MATTGYHVSGTLQTGSLWAAASTAATANTPKATCSQHTLPAVVFLYDSSLLDVLTVRLRLTSSYWHGHNLCTDCWEGSYPFLSHITEQLAYTSERPSRCVYSKGHNNPLSYLHRSFVQKNLLVEITSNARLARVFGWLLKRHTFASYSLYTAGDPLQQILEHPQCIVVSFGGSCDE